MWLVIIDLQLLMCWSWQEAVSEHDDWWCRETCWQKGKWQHVCVCVHSSAAVCSCWINFSCILFWNDLKSRCQCGGWGWRSFQSPRVLHVIHKELWPAFCSLTLELSLTLSNMLAHLMPHPRCLYGTRISCIITQLLFRTGLWADRRLNRRRPGTPRVSCLCSHV